MQTNVTGVCGEHSQCSGHTRFALAHGLWFPHLHCSGSRLLSREWGLGCVRFPCLYCSGSRLLSRERALSCMHFPGLSRSDSGFWVLHKDTLLVGPAFCAFPAQEAQAARNLMSALSPDATRLIPSAVPASVSAHQSGTCALCLFWGAGL